VLLNGRLVGGSGAIEVMANSLNQVEVGNLVHEDGNFTGYGVA